MNRYNRIAERYINNLKNKNLYREFLEIRPLNGPLYHDGKKSFINWCSNDYNRSIQNRDLINSVVKFFKSNGIGSGGTRNISGTSEYHTRLEKKMAKIHKKESGLVFNSGFLANYSSIETLGKLFPNSKIYSDEFNHSSIIKGIKSSNLDKVIFPHNDMDILERELKYDNNKFKIILLESMYSMDGSIPNFEDIIYLKNKYNAFTFIDEIHAVGIYGDNGGGLTERYDCQDSFDIIMGGFGKGFGVQGGYITGNKYIVDSVRCSGSGFIFTTSIPPVLAFASIRSVDIVNKTIIKNYYERLNNIQYFKKRINYDTNFEFIPCNFENSHINSIYIGDSKKCRDLSKELFTKYSHYIQPIFYPTVPIGTDRLRICITHDHTFDMIDDLIDSLNKC